MKKIGKIKNGVFTPYANMSSSGPGDISNTPITFEQATELANVQSGDPVSVALGKLSKLYAALESGSASTLLGENLEANRIMITDGGGKVSVSTITKDRLINLKMLDLGTTRTALLESAEIGITGFLTHSDTPIEELPSGSIEWRYAEGLLIKRSALHAAMVIYGYGTGNIAITATTDGGQTWTDYKNPQTQIDFLNAALDIGDWNIAIKELYDEECTSHIDVLKKHWSEIFLYDHVGSMGAYRLVITGYGTNKNSWLCWAYGNALYGYALHLPYSNKLAYYQINNGTWSEIHELVTYNEFNPVAQNVKGIKTWSVSEWTKAGGNLPVNNGTGAIMRMQGYTNPGETMSSGSYYIYLAYTNNNTCQLYIGQNILTGSKVVTWYQLALKQ